MEVMLMSTYLGPILRDDPVQAKELDKERVGVLLHVSKVLW